MEYKVQIHPDHVEAILSGEFDLAICKDSVDEVFRVCGQHALSKVLVNGMNLTNDVPVVSRFSLGEYLASHAAQRVRFAIVSSPDVIQKSKALQNTANNRGAQVITTDSMQEAQLFLGIVTP